MREVGALSAGSKIDSEGACQSHLILVRAGLALLTPKLFQRVHRHSIKHHDACGLRSEGGEQASIFVEYERDGLDRHLTSNHFDWLVLLLGVVHTNVPVHCRGVKPLAIGRVHDLEHGTTVLLLFMDRLCRGHIKDAHGAALESAGQQVAAFARVVAEASWAISCARRVLRLGKELTTRVRILPVGETNSYF